MASRTRAARTTPSPARNDATGRVSSRRAGKRLVFTNGRFGLLHRGHVACLQAARAPGNAIIVGPDSNTPLRKLRGPGHPVIPQKNQRRRPVRPAVGGRRCSWSSTRATPTRLMRELGPVVYVKGGNYRAEDLPEAEVAGESGVEVGIIPFEEDYSTTALIEKIRNAPRPGQRRIGSRRPMVSPTGRAKRRRGGCSLSSLER